MRFIILIATLFCGDYDAIGATFQHKKLEFGVGALSIRGNHYRGADQYKNYLIPTPYFVYTSDKIEAEPSFIRGSIYKKGKFQIKLSLNLGLNVEGEENSARAGMPGLDYTFEAGPMFIYNIWKAKDNNSLLNFEFPIRQVFTTDLSYIRRIGTFYVPFLNWIHYPQKSTLGWGSEISVAAMWGSRGFHQHFYGVQDQFATSNRPAYVAAGGFSGTQWTWILNKRLGNLVFTPFFRYDNLKNTAFEEGPLVRKKDYFIFGLGFFWLFYSAD